MNLYETIEHLLRSNPNFVRENAVSNLDRYLVKIFKNNN